MGIVNITPDSFSDGGDFFAAQSAIDRGLQMVAEGADIIDVGGESTRPYADAVSAEEELRRISQVIETLCQKTKIPISIDTTKAVVAQRAIELGAEIVNDVSGLERDPAMIEVVRQSGVGVCVMHAQGTPQTMQDDPNYQDVVEEIYNYLDQRKQSLVRAGISPEKICLDPGIGFGKTHEHNLTLMRNCQRFLDLDSPILIGHSRKGFIGKLIGDPQADRTAGTLGASLAAAVQGMHVLRVHDVKATRDALTTFIACAPAARRLLQ
jgi:dihydropteroate synthase